MRKKLTMEKNLRGRKNWNCLPAVVLLAFCFGCFCPAVSYGTETAEELKILFTHDMHDYYYPRETVENGVVREHGGIARLASILKENRDENTLYLDAGDFSMGTLYQAAFSSEACELRLLGQLGCRVTTFGNHEFDYGAAGVAQALRSAKNSGDPLPQIVLSNIDFSGELTEEQKDLKAAFDAYGVREYTILDCAGYRIGVFSLEGYDSIDCIQTEVPFSDCLEQAKLTVKKLQEENCDLIVALSHAGTDGEGGGEDAELAKNVPDIDIIISAHTHSLYTEPVLIGKTVLASAGEYLKYVGELKVLKDGAGLQVTGYRLIPVDGTVEEDPETLSMLEEYQKAIEESYLKEQAGENTKFDQVIAHSDFDTVTVEEMHAAHGEYNTGNLIADSYRYAAEKNGIDDIDVALVGLGTIRGSIRKGFITVADAFEICSLGVGSDGSAGHPLVCAYITGKELKLMTELDASLGTLVNYIKMSYSGLSFSFNESRVLLDRVTQVQLVQKDGSIEEIEDEKLYKVCANMYAVNMLGMLNGLTKGVLSITPKYADGTPIEDFYTVAMRREDGTEVKEWIAFKEYLESFPAGEEQVPEIPEIYRGTLGRKVKYSAGGLEAITRPGTATKVMPVLLAAAAAVLALLTAGIVFLVKRPGRKRAQKFLCRQETADKKADGTGEPDLLGQDTTDQIRKQKREETS